MLQAPLLDGLNCGSMNERLATSVEVTASKIFPAGAGWQLASIVADSAGMNWLSTRRMIRRPAKKANVVASETPTSDCVNV